MRLLTCSEFDGLACAVLLKVAGVIDEIKFVLNRTSRTDIGSLMLAYGGGGHRQVGTCQVPHDEAEAVLAELIARMRGWIAT